MRSALQEGAAPRAATPRTLARRTSFPPATERRGEPTRDVVCAKRLARPLLSAVLDVIPDELRGVFLEDIIDRVQECIEISTDLLALLLERLTGVSLLCFLGLRRRLGLASLLAHAGPSLFSSNL